MYPRREALPFEAMMEKAPIHAIEIALLPKVPCVDDRVREASLDAVPFLLLMNSVGTPVINHVMRPSPE